MATCTMCAGGLSGGAINLNMKDFSKVFAANPKANEIYVVERMPFTHYNHARNFANGDEDKIRTVKRPSKSTAGTEVPGTTAPKGKTAKKPSGKKKDGPPAPAEAPKTGKGQNAADGTRGEGGEQPAR